ncbi:hypothetical protein [Amycolatopsis sp. cg9]|uniref:hypothetical protein n=1 Tax=Amycolatopsis sp. cg9 TaxID=3238801 RepID=UPI0035246351
MTSDREAPGASALATARQTFVEGPVAETGDVNLEGKYVAGHTLNVNHYGPQPEEGALPFLVVDKAYLEEQAGKPKRVYVARSPDWADVVHGADSELRFIERDQTAALRDAVREELLAPIARGTDHQLHSLFVLGAPGSGKTTLVRRVAAMLVLAGECVVVDFGVKTERVTSGDVAAYIRAMDRIAGEGVPVLMLLDDPFFANSGWVELLQALGRPQHQGVSVLGASPDFLFRRFAHWLFGKQVVGRNFDITRPSTGERRQLAQLHDRDPASLLTTEEDLLVVAMEAAAGESFRDIMQRIWITLNDGVPVDPNADVRRLPWPVVAFAMICYFHRHYVLCPESLLHEFLSNILDEAPPDLLAQALEELVTQEGWRIFSVHFPRQGHPGSRLIGATHARVAREAWRYRPTQGLNVEKGVIDASVQALGAAPQLAEMILVQRPSLRSQLAKHFAARWSAAVEDGTMETKSLCALVRALKPSRDARMTFRPVLRRCLSLQNRQSWLAAWQLYHLSSGNLLSQEREALLMKSLPGMLKIADLSAGPAESIEIARRTNTFRDIVVERLRSSLRGELDWTVDAQQAAWLLKSLPSAEVADLLERVYEWLENASLDDEGGSSRTALVVKTLLTLYDAGGLLGDGENARLFSVVLDWQLTTPEMNQDVLQALLGITEGALNRGDPNGGAALDQLLDLLCEHSGSNEAAWNVFLAALGRLSGTPDLLREVLPRVARQLADRPEVNESSWAAVLSMAGRDPDLAPEIVAEVIGQLQARPENYESVWVALPSTFARFPDLARAFAPRLFAWLWGRPDGNDAAWGAVLSMFGRVPELADLAREVVPGAVERLLERPDGNEAAWSAVLSMFGRVPELTGLAREVVPLVFEWLCQRPESNESSWAALLSTFGRVPELADLAREVVPGAVERLLERPDGNEAAWSAVLSMFGRVPELTGLAREVVPLVFEWLCQRPESNESSWAALLSTFGRVPELADLAREVVPGAVERLLERPENNEGAWAALFSAFGRVPELADLAREVVPGAVERLLERPDGNDAAWSAVLSIFGRVSELTGLAREVVPLVFEWLRRRPESNESSWATLFSMFGRVPELADLTREIVPGAVERLLERPENNEGAWAALFSTFGRVPELGGLAREVVPLVFAWLLRRPEGNKSSWAALLSTFGRVPELADLAREIVPQAVERVLERTESNEYVWNASFSALSRVPELADLAPGIVARGFDWLLQRPESNESSWAALLSTFGRVPGLADLAREIVPGAVERLLKRPEGNEGAWAALLSAFGRVPELADLAREIIPKLFEQLLKRPEANESIWLALPSALGPFPDLARDFVPRAHEWLLEHESNEGAWGSLLLILGRIPELRDLSDDIVPEVFELLRSRFDPGNRVWTGMVLALSSPAGICAGSRAEMLGTLSGWFGDRPPENVMLRSVRLLRVAGGEAEELVSTVLAELVSFEENPDRRADFVLVQALAYAVARTGRPDIEARFAAVERRSRDVDETEVADIEPPPTW